MDQSFPTATGGIWTHNLLTELLMQRDHGKGVLTLINIMLQLLGFPGWKMFSSKNGTSPGSFYIFRSFQIQILQKTTVDVRGIRTQIVGEEGELADHLTTTTAKNNWNFASR